MAALSSVPSSEIMYLTCFIRLLLLGAAVATAARAQTPLPNSEVKSVRANGVTLHYIERGKGPPVVLVHGGLEDYRSWEPQMAGFAESHRVVAYSRRYNYPNSGAPILKDYSALVDAEDLAALIRKLKLGPVHLVGISYGAYTALLVAVKHPALVRSLVLCEPPLMRWLPELEGGQPLFAEFMAKVWQPTTRGFQQGDEPGLKAAIDGFGSLGYVLGPETATFAALPAEVRGALLGNALEWKTLTQSRDAFPNVPFAEVRKIRVPTLLLSGANTLALQKVIDPKLLSLLRHGHRVILPDASHEMWSEQPDACRKAALEFIDRPKRNQPGS